jgi:hypothetical protein
MSPEMQNESTAPRRESPRKVGGAWTAVRRILPAGAAGLALAATLAINEHLRAGAMLFPASIRLWAVLLAVLVPAALAAGWWLREPESRPARLWAGLPAALLMAGAVVLLFSGATLHPWTYFLGWLPHTGDGWAALRTGVPLFILLTAMRDAVPDQAGPPSGPGDVGGAGCGANRLPGHAPAHDRRRGALQG